MITISIIKAELTVRIQDAKESFQMDDAEFFDYLEDNGITLSRAGELLEIELDFLPFPVLLRLMDDAVSSELVYWQPETTDSVERLIRMRTDENGTLKTDVGYVAWTSCDAI